MSKINAVRIINLNYNNNAICISDETFQLGGQSTLFSLRNGGGKSVLVQMMTAPFVHKQYRKTKDRPFESYFTTAKPTFILVEWVLDHGSGYCLTGMMVRKSQALEEQSAEPLEIINFISEYTTRCEQDIYNLPVVEKTKKEVALKGFAACRQLFETYKRDKSMKFFYYDMNNHAQSRQYFDKLAEYRIYYKEWENIIKKVNVKESGLSELFIDCKNEKDLIEKWFMPTVESKLNRESDRMKEFQSIIGKYVTMYKDNKSKIERRDTILKFKEDMLAVEEKAKRYQEQETKVQELENRIACFIKELYRLEALVQQEVQGLEEKRLDCEKEIAHVMYEKLSMEVHQLAEELRNRSSNRDMLGFERDALEEELGKIEYQIHLFECARQQEQVTECRKEYRLLTEKLDVLKRDEEELEPERQRIGSRLNQYYRNCLSEHTDEVETKREEQEETEAKCLAQKQKETECQNRLSELLVSLTECRSKIKTFGEKEADFNRNYNEKFVRNIVGDYEAGYLEIKQAEYQKQQEELIRRCANHGKLQNEAEEQKRSCERSIEDKRRETMQQEYCLKELENEGKELQKQLEERRVIMRYLELDETKLWQQEKLLEAADRKLTDINRRRSELEQEVHTLRQEWKKLTSGEVMELPEDFEELLKELELHPVSGMRWLEKNGYSEEENQRLVRRQPFLPYSLILPRAEIKKLEQQEKEVYTSFPIPLIPREALEEVLAEKDSSVLHLSGISFYLWFNEKLLNEEALRVLIAQKDAEIQKKQEQVEKRQAEYEEYLAKKNRLAEQRVTKELLEQNQNSQTEVEERIEALEENIRKAQEERRELEQTIKELQQTIQKERQEIDWCKRRETDFGLFCKAYESYTEQRKEEERIAKEQTRVQEAKDRAAVQREALEEGLKTLEAEALELKRFGEELQRSAAKYEGFEPDEQQNTISQTEKTTEEEAQKLEARYEAITTQMSMELQELERQQEKQRGQLEKAEGELKRLQTRFGLADNAWKNTIFNEKECRHQESLQEDRKKKLAQKNYAWNEEDKQIGIINSRIVDKKKGILEQCGKEEPLPKAEIFTVDFDARKNQLDYQKKELIKESRRVEKQLNSLKGQLDAFSEYQDFMVREVLVWEEEFLKMEEEALRKFAGVMRRDYREDMENQKREKGRLEQQLHSLLRKESYQEDYYRKPLEAMLAVTEQAALVLEQLHTTVQSYDSQMEKLAVDIGMVEKEKERLEGLLEDYVKEVHNNLSQIDNNSTITIREKPIKMLRLQLPDWEENEGLYKQRLDDFMNELTQSGVEIYERNENAADYFGVHVTTKNLYNSVVGIGNIQIRLYKIEEQREYAITWAEVAKNSGGEGFLSAFVVLASLLHYMRRDATDIFADKNEGKVLVMDNPFAQTNAAHLLKPLIDMAKKMNTQLICLSGLGGDSIYGRFDNIYVLNLVAASLRNGTMYLRGEHRRGTEEETIVASQIEVVEQMTLF